jgi:FolB domain-containing protein
LQKEPFQAAKTCIFVHLSVLCESQKQLLENVFAMDKIFITDLTVMTIVGTRPDERLSARPLKLNVIMYCPLESAGKTDDLFQSVNYQEAAELLLDLGKKSSFLLIEAFAENAAALLLDKFELLQSVTITVDKPHAIGSAASVAVEITRSRKA